MEKLRWYRKRWQIEVFHKILQHGCAVEQCRLQTQDRLNRYITLMSIIAWRLFWMTHLQRIEPTACATRILSETEIRTLIALENQAINDSLPALSVAQAVIAIAKLGGFVGRKGDGETGPTVIWRGWTVLQNAARLGAYLFPQTYG